MTRPLPFYRHCCVCGDKRRGSLGLRFRQEDEKVVADFVPSDRHIGYPGIVHGGILASVLDEAMAWAIYAHSGLFALSSELKVRFIKPLPPGQPVRVVAYPVAVQRNVYETTAEVQDDSGVVYARAWGRWFPAPAEQNAQWLQLIEGKPSPVP